MAPTYAVPGLFQLAKGLLHNKLRHFLIEIIFSKTLDFFADMTAFLLISDKNHFSRFI